MIRRRPAALLAVASLLLAAGCGDATAGWWHPTPALDVASPAIALGRGSSFAITVTMTGEAQPGSWRVRGDALPRGVTLDESALDANGGATVTLHVDASAEVGDVALRLVASDGDREASAEIALTIGSAAGAEDPTFGDQGVATIQLPSGDAAWLADLRVRPDGEIVLAANSSAGAWLVQLGADGRPDEGFGDASGAIALGTAYSVASIGFFVDRTIGIGATDESTAGAPRPVVMLRHPDGEAYEGFGSEAGVASFDDLWGTTRATALLPDGGFVTACAWEGSKGGWLAGVSNGGSLSTGFGAGGIADVRSTPEAFAMDADGAIVLGSGTGLDRLLPSGEPDRRFGENGHLEFGHPAASLVVDGEGRYVTLADDGVLFVTDARGVPDRAFAQQTAGTMLYADNVAIGADGSLLVAGCTDTAWKLARHTKEGALDVRFGAGGVASRGFGKMAPAEGQWAAKIGVQPDGRIVVASSTCNGLGCELSVHRYFP